MEQNEISLAEFFSVCIHLAEESGNIIRDVWKSGKLELQEKDAGEGPVTVADLRVQKTLEENPRNKERIPSPCSSPQQTDWILSLVLL